MKERIRKLATSFTTRADDLRRRAVGLFEEFRRPLNSARNMFIGGSGVARIGSVSFRDQMGFDNFLGEVGKFNPLFIEPWMMKLMKRSVMPRLGLIIIGAALNERSYVVEGSDPETEAFHQAWIDELMPSVLKASPSAVWYGNQPLILDWTVTDDGDFIPFKARDVDPFNVEIIETEVERDFAGFVIEGQYFDRRRAFLLTWDGEHGNHHGVPMALTVYPYFWAASILICWTMKYYQRSVDPVRLAMAQNVSVATGEIDPTTGDPVYVDLTEIVAEAMDIADGGDSAAVPMGDEGEKLVDIKTLDLPDRADTYLKMLAFLEEKQLLATLNLPGIGIASTGGDVKGQDARASERTQIRILEHISNMPIAAMNELLAYVHRQNKKPGPPPKLRGKAFKREQQETILSLFQTAMEQPHPEVGPDGVTGRAYRPSDLLQFDKMARSLDLPINDVAEVARAPDELLEQAPGKGGRPEEPLNPIDTASPDTRNVTRSETRAATGENRA